MKVHVGNLSKSISDAELNAIVLPFGAPESAEVVKDRISGESRGYGFVVFNTTDEAQAAIAGLDGKDVEGQVLKVSEARSPKDRERPRA
jgi:cold-inducible RNA-binding protein